MRKSFTQSELNQIETLHLQGKTNAEIAVIMGRTHGAVKYQLLKLPSFTPRGVRRYTCDFDFFKTIDTAQKAYWLGFICGDGNIYRNVLHIGIHQQDHSFLEQFIKDISGNYPVVKSTNTSKGKPSTISRVDLHHKNFPIHLATYGVVPAKTGNMSWDKIEENVPNEFMKNFILGFFDADGMWVTTNSKGQARFTIGEKGGHLIKGILEYLRENVTPTKSNVFKRKQDDFYILSIGGNKNLLNLFNYFYEDNPFCMRRKFKRISNFLQKWNYSNFSNK